MKSNPNPNDFKASAALLLDSVATFTATELLSYNTFIFYTVVASMVALPRKELKAKVIDAPEILQVIEELPHMAELLDGMYPRAGRHGGRPRQRQHHTATPATAKGRGASPPPGQRPQPLPSQPPALQRPPRD